MLLWNDKKEKGDVIMLDHAIKFASKAFNGRTDEKGEPYINHAIRVADKMDTELEKIVAVLHDVLEDSDCTVYDLQDAGFSREVIEYVEQLTRKSDFTYFEYIEDVATSDICKKVKLAELEDNQDVVRVNKLSFKTYSLEARCKKVEEILSR